MSLFQNDLDEHITLINALRNLEDEVLEAAALISMCLVKGGKILLAGNGGSAADCQHLAAEFVGRFIKNRQALAAVALTVDSSVITCISNDFGYDQVFSRQIEGVGCKGDVLVAISTSGRSQSIINAITVAKSIGITTVALLGRDGGVAKGLAECEIIVPSGSTARVQEAHILIGHFLCGEVERLLLK